MPPALSQLTLRHQHSPTVQLHHIQKKKFCFFFKKSTICSWWRVAIIVELPPFFFLKVMSGRFSELKTMLLVL
jgi:hypothetical protein